MAKNLFKSLLKPQASVGRNGFDLSQKHMYSALAGQCVPVFVEDLQPGDYFDISAAVKCRTMPFNTAAWFDCKVNYDYFFVPYEQLWHPWKQFYYQTSNPYSAIQEAQKDYPLYQPNIKIYDIIAWMASLLYPYGATSIDEAGRAKVLGACKLLDMCGYGQFYKLAEVTTAEELDTVASWYSNHFQDRTVSPFRLQAYRKIWHDYYCMKWRDKDSKSSAYFYNLDDYFADTFADSIVPSSRFAWFLQMKYAPYRKDVFMSSLPDRQTGAVSGIDVSSLLWYVNSSGDLANISTVASSSAGGATLRTRGQNVDSSSLDVVLSNAFSVYQLKQAEKLQEWKEKHMRAGCRVVDQQRAMFGVTDKSDENHDLVNHIGGFSMQVMIDDIRSTEVGTPSSERPNGFLGELGGTGIGYGTSGHVKYEAKEHGVLMCVASIIPNFSYDSTGVDKMVQRSEPLDYFNPQYDNLGLSPITVNDYQGSWYDSDNEAEYQDDVIGFAPQYWEYKSRVDKAHMSFRSGGVNQHFGVLRKGFETSGITSFPTSQFYIDPALLDSVFMVNANVADMSTDQFIFDAFFDVKAVRPMSKLGLVNFD